jgi:hypothetical protein
MSHESKHLWRVERVKWRWILYGLMAAALLYFLWWLLWAMVLLGSVGGIYP